MGGKHISIPKRKKEKKKKNLQVTKCNEILKAQNNVSIPLVWGLNQSTGGVPIPAHVRGERNYESSALLYASLSLFITNGTNHNDSIL